MSYNNYSEDVLMSLTALGFPESELREGLREVRSSFQPTLIVSPRYLDGCLVGFVLTCDHALNKSPKLYGKFQKKPIPPARIDTSRPRWKLSMIRWIQSATFAVTEMKTKSEQLEHDKRRLHEARITAAAPFLGTEISPALWNCFANTYGTNEAGPGEEPRFTITDLHLRSFHIPIALPEGLTVAEKGFRIRKFILACMECGIIPSGVLNAKA